MLAIQTNAEQFVFHALAWGLPVQPRGSAHPASWEDGWNRRRPYEPDRV